MNYQHRLAQQQDLAAIVAIYNSTIASRMVTADTTPVSVAERQAWFDAHQQPQRPLWVVENAAQEIIGWLSFSNFYGRPAYSGTAEISIYIAESARGLGLGRYLLQQAIHAAPSLELHTLLGFIFGHNQPSLQLFKAFDFSLWANLPGVAVLDGVARDLIILGKKLA